jgi:hypothetical protein
MADEARLNEILDLVEQARAEGDTETEAKAIAAYKRETAPVDNPAQYGGAGGYNPMLGRLSGAAIEGGSELGMTPENVSSPMLNMFGPLEVGAQMATGTGATILGGVAGLAQGAWNSVVPERFEGQPAADAVREVQDKLTYQPRTGMGQGMSRVAGFPAEVYGKATDRGGEAISQITGMPSLGAGFKTVADAAPSLLFRRSLSEVPRGPRPKGDYTSKPSQLPVPTTAQLTAASKDAYKAGKESGVIVPANGYVDALGKVRTMATEEGLDPTLHPKSTAVMKRLEAAAGKDLSLQEAETLRKIALDAEDDINIQGKPTPDARLATKIVDELDDSIEALSTNNEARALWARSRRSQMLDTMIHRAEIKAGAHYTQAGMEHALRQEFKQLSLNPRRMRGLTAEQRAAVEKVAKGGPIENTLRAIGRFDPTSGFLPGFASLVTGGALPVAGFAGRRLATRATSKNVDLARESLVGRGIDPNAGLLSKDNPTPLVGGPQGLLSGKQTPATAKARSAEVIQSDIRRLTSRVQFELATESAGSPKVQQAIAELQALQRELAATQAD